MSEGGRERGIGRVRVKGRRVGERTMSEEVAFRHYTFAVSTCLYFYNSTLPLTDNVTRSRHNDREVDTQLSIVYFLCNKSYVVHELLELYIYMQL